MQELKSISTASGTYSEKQQLKGFSWLAYDPLGEALFQVSQGGSGIDRCPAILRTRDYGLVTGAAWEHLNLEHSSCQEEMKSKEIEAEAGAASGQLKSLAALRRECREVPCEAHPESEPQYLLPYQIGDATSADGKQIFTTDTTHEPDCLRFCPSNSTENVEISISGFTVRAKATNQVARANKGFYEGVHYWEIICPISLSTLQIGVSNKSSKDEVTQQFRTTTPRVVGIELNLEKLTLNFWLNGRYIKERQKKLAPNQRWYPIVKFKEPDYFVVINPFGQHRGTCQEESCSNYLPNALRTNESQFFTRFLSLQLKDYVLAHGLTVLLKKEDIEPSEEKIRKLLRIVKLDPHEEEKEGDKMATTTTQDVELIFKDLQPDQESTQVLFAFLRFSNEQEAVKYYIKNKDLKLLTPRQIASLVRPAKASEKQDLPYAISLDVLEYLNSTVLPRPTLEPIRICSGHTADYTNHHLQKTLTLLEESIKNNKIEFHSTKTHDKPQATSQVHYLAHSDKLLLVNDSEMKLLSRDATDFPQQSLSFTHSYPTSVFADVRLDLPLSDLSFLLTHLDWSLLQDDSIDIMTRFLNLCQTKMTNDDSIMVPYSLGLIAVKMLLNVAITQFELLEQSFESLQDQEILHKYQPSQTPSKLQSKDKGASQRNEILIPFEYGCVSLVDAHQLLSILVELEDQFWAMIQTDQVPSSVKELWTSRSTSRLHTSYGRLASLITLPGTAPQLPLTTLSDQGLVSTSDKYGRLQHYQDFRTELENLLFSEAASPQALQQALERQLPQNVLVKGMRTWNVKVAKTLNKMPAQVHEGGIEKVKKIEGADFVMSCGNANEVKVWNTKLQMLRVGEYRFKEELKLEKNEAIMKEIFSESPQEVKLILASSHPNQISSSAKPGQLGGKSIQSAASATLASSATTLAQLEDILFTMFEEQPGEGNGAQSQMQQQIQEEFDSESDSEKDPKIDLSQYLFDYFEQPAGMQPAPAAPKKAKAKEEEEVKEEVKEAPPKKTTTETVGATEKEKEQEKQVEPSVDLLHQLTLMGFPLELSKKGLIKVKNASAEAAIDIIMELQAEDLKKKSQPKALKIAEWQCLVCTYMNVEGKGACEMCGSGAPQHAYIIQKSEEDIKREKDDGEAKKKKEEDEKNRIEQERIAKEEAEQKKIEEERIRKEKEELEVKLKEELKQKTIGYYEDAKIVDHIFAQYKGCHSKKPLIAGAVVKSSLNHTHDIHLVRFSYRTSYLNQFINLSAGPRPICQVCDVPFLTTDSCLEHIFNTHKDLFEAYYPIFIGQQQISKSFDFKSNRLFSNTLRAEIFATIVLPFEHLDSFCQIGDDITEQNPLYIVSVGRKKNSSIRSVCIQKLDETLTLSNVFEMNDASNFLGSNLSTQDLKSLSYCPTSQNLVLQTQSGAHFFSVDFDTLKLTKRGEVAINEGEEKLLGVQQGVIYIMSNQANTARRVLIDQKRSKKVHDHLADCEPKREEIEQALLSESDILQMQIDPKDVTAKDIRRYEKLMSGKAVLALSNATKMLGPELSDSNGQQQLYTKHHWILDNKVASPLEIEFEHPTSLISLNLELTFACKDSASYFEWLKAQQPTLSKQPSTSQSISKFAKVQSESPMSNLGLLSIQGASSYDANSNLTQNTQSISAAESSSKQQNYLPLIVDHHKGASYNQGFQVSRVVMDNDKIFASNYPRPEFYFKHIQGLSITVDKFTVRSNVQSKCGAFPIGSGIIFGADHMQAFEKTVAFHKFTRAEYQEWRQERVKDSTPLRSWEPIAYFEFESETQISFEPDCQRTYKYIFLKPTGFRKKPTAFTQNMSQAPLEIEFFGITGSAIDDSEINSGPSFADQESGSQELVNGSKYELELSVLNNKKTLKVLKDIDVQNIIGFDQVLTSRTLSAIQKPLDKRVQLTGRTFLKITDSNLQLQKVKGLSLMIKHEEFENDIWELRGITVQGIAAGQETSISSSGLFRKPEIPLSYMRSCLLSPKFYNVVNKVLALMISNQGTSASIRGIVIQFLNKIMKLNRDFVPLILRDINLEKFLKINLFYGDPSSVQLVVEFLQNFQKDVSFCNTLFNILLDEMESLPEKFMSYHGYEALIGLLKWAMPINPEKTLSHLVSIMYNKICLKKVPALQTNENINFRSRYSYNTFPFDLATFKSSKNVSTARKDSPLQISGRSYNLLPVKYITRTKYDSHHIFEVEFASSNYLVTDLRLFIGQAQENVYFKLIIKIYGGEQFESLVYFNTFEEQFFYQIAQTGGPGPKSSIANSNTDFLHLPHLSIQNQKIKVVIEYGSSYSSIPKSNQKKVNLDSLIEFYGQSLDPHETPNSLRELVDIKAAEFWANKSTICSVGRSIPMLQKVIDSTQSVLVPQGSQSSPQPSPNQEKENHQSLHTAEEKNAAQEQHNLMSELELLQEELKGKLKAKESNLKEIVDKIQQIHHSMEKYDMPDYSSTAVVPSLEYYLTIVSDITKVIKCIIKSQKQLSQDQVSMIIREVDRANNGDLSFLSFEIFKRFIVYDQGPHVKQDALQFIVESLYPIMTKEETRKLIFRIIEEFLSKPQSIFSQKSVLESVNMLGIPEGELISFMIQRLNIKVKELPQLHALTPSKSDHQPFVFMSSILILALNSLKQISIPEPGQALHKGISCLNCHIKHIVGWRYKCGNCPGDADFCEKCVNKHLIDQPDHVTLIIQEPLPYNTSQKTALKAAALGSKNAYAPILPTFEFKEASQSEDINAAMTHEGVNCENCGKKPVIGNLYKCANCEDYNLCEQCYTQNQFEHFSYHIFMKFTKPLKLVEKNPTTILQVLDPRLYPSQSQHSKDTPQKKKSEAKPAVIDDDENIDDLEPLNMSRSLSVPMSQKGRSKGKQQTSTETTLDKLDCDQQFVVLFHTCVWITQDQQSAHFSKEEKIVLLKLNIDTMLQLIKLTGIKYILDVVQNKEAFFQLLVSVLQLNSKDLITLFKTLLDHIRQPPSLQRKIKEDKIKQQKQKLDAKTTQKKQQLLEELALMKKLLETLISHTQTFLKWLIDLGIQPDLAKLQAIQGQEVWSLLINSYTNQRVWLDHLSLILELFIKQNDELKEHIKNANSESQEGAKDKLEKIPEEQFLDGAIDNDEDLVPLAISRSVSLPITNAQRNSAQQQSQSSSLQLIKFLVQLLFLNDQQPLNKSVPAASHFRETESQTKYLSSMWSLVLKSLTTVTVNQLIEAKIFDQIVNAFLISTEEIKQITYPQILSITEVIATQSVHTNDMSKFICNLFFLTLENVTDTHHEKVGYSICQGWLDILISAQTSRPPAFESSKTVYAKMSGEELSVYLKKTSTYLIQSLNKCSFEGSTGSQLQIIMRINLACDLLYVIRFAENKTKAGSSAFQELVGLVSTNSKLKKDFTESMNNLLAWLFLNARQAKDDQITSQLGNSSALTPATQKIKQMTEYIEEAFTILAESDRNEAAIKISLSSMTNIVRRMNKTIIDLATNNQIGFDVSTRLSERTNEYFTRLLGQWLVSDSVASYFVFDLGGFEFLLDTIGQGGEHIETIVKTGRKSSGGEGGKMEENVKAEKNGHSSPLGMDAPTSSLQSLEGSDLAQYLESTILEFQATQLKPLDSQPSVQMLEQVPSVIQGQYDKTNPVFVQEFSKSMLLVSSNGGDLPATYAKTDWSVNKRSYKHRIIIKHLNGYLRPEYWILFQLPQPTEIREIQIGFANYWVSDTEVYAEPLSVLVEAGMDENNLTQVCNLHIVKDDAFGSVSATVFGQNLQSFNCGQTTTSSSESIEDLITQKLQSLQNCKVQYLKFRMRRHVLTCLENSPLSTKYTKQPAFAINYISVLGFDMTKIGEFLSYIKQEQKKTALEILSIICSGDFSSILKVIANQEQTIDKIKQSFNLLASLVSIKANLIEPTFIAISTYNTEMGDWIINQFLKGSRNYRHAQLVGEIVICNKAEMPRRLNLLKDFVMSQLRQITQEERSQHGTLIKKVLPFVKVCIQTLRVAAPDLDGVFSSPPDLGTKESQLTDIISLLSAATQEREFQTKILTQLLILLLCPPSPFINSNVDALHFAQKYLIEDQQSLLPTSSQQDENQQQRENIASILSATRTLIAQEILESGLKLDKLLNPGKGSQVGDSEKVNNTQLQQAIKFWINVSQDKIVREKLGQDKIPLKLYEILRSDNPEKSQKIIRRDSVIHEQELDLMIELIKYLVAGDADLEKELADMMMKDLEHMSGIRDMNFVNKVFLPLLRIEKTVPVCLWPYDSENKKWLSTFKPESIGDQSVQVSSQVSHNNFVPSQLLQGEKRSTFIKNFKEIVGQHSKGTAKKLMSSNWTLAHSQTEQGQVSQFQAFWKSIENKSPVVALISGTNSSGSNVVFGCYCSKGIPQMAANLAQDTDYPVSSQPEDFVFCYIDETSFHHFAPKSGVPIISMFTDYEGGGALSVANDFMLMTFSFDFVFTTGTVYDVEKIQESNNPKPAKEVDTATITFQKFEVWSPSSSVTKEIAASSQPANTLKVGLAPIPSQINAQTELELSIASEFKHAWYNPLIPYVHFRTSPVFMVPAHLNLSQLSKIMLDSSVSFKVRSSNLHLQPMSSHPNTTDTLETIFSSLSADRKALELQNGIIDLEYEMNQLLNVKKEEVKEAQPEEAQAADGSNQQAVMQGYVPKMGLFESFELQGGVKAIIQVTLQSLKMWKADEQAKTWELWLRELESFAEIPLFFQLFLKNTRCKDLLFKVLAGLPDTEITQEGSKSEAKTRWAEEQKAAVQFNYKILSEAFSISTDLKLRETAMKCGLLPRILERLGQISGEKARQWDEESGKEEEKKESTEQVQQISQTEKNVDKKKRKGVGYASKVGQIFNVAEYLENKKLRNEQIKNLIDICSNFINCKEWKASEEVQIIVLESALLPLLESAFRNGSWLDMAKEHEVYHSYLALARALAQHKHLIPCLAPIDPKYKPTQTEAIYKLLAKLNDLAEIFINCLNQQTKAEQQVSFLSSIFLLMRSFFNLQL